MANDWATFIATELVTQMGPLRNFKYLQKPLENFWDMKNLKGTLKRPRGTLMDLEGHWRTLRDPEGPWGTWILMDPDGPLQSAHVKMESVILFRFWYLILIPVFGGPGSRIFERELMWKWNRNKITDSIPSPFFWKHFRITLVTSYNHQNCLKYSETI